MKTTIEKSPRPANGRWDWSKRYWNVGDAVRLHAGLDARIPKDVPAVVTGWTVNTFGRVMYAVRAGRKALEGVSLEVLVGPYRPGKGRILLAAKADGEGENHDG